MLALTDERRAADALRERLEQARPRSTAAQHDAQARSSGYGFGS